MIAARKASRELVVGHRHIGIHVLAVGSEVFHLQRERLFDEGKITKTVLVPQELAGQSDDGPIMRLVPARKVLVNAFRRDPRLQVALPTGRAVRWRRGRAEIRRRTCKGM